MISPGHVPVLLKEALDYLDSGRPGTYIDGTLGLGGHTLEILRTNPEASVIAFDRDERALLEARKRLEDFGNRVTLFHSDFKDMPLDDIDFAKVRGILLDLGISSFQLDSPDRGFSYNIEGPLDMRMDLRLKTTAARILDKTPESKLEEIFRNYGELPHTRRLAREIVSRRKFRPFETTSDLRRLVEEIYRWRPQKGKSHPAARVFQALRIEINSELEGLGEFLEKIAGALRPEARIAVISFHSLEDRIVKRTFLGLASPENGKPVLGILTKKPVTASEEEIESNSRAHSAKLRAAVRI
jgi:16S rRNA (cytosine1402-N4)-methyltransferase